MTVVKLCTIGDVYAVIVYILAAINFFCLFSVDNLLLQFFRHSWVNNVHALYFWSPLLWKKVKKNVSNQKIDFLKDFDHSGKVLGISEANLDTPCHSTTWIFFFLTTEFLYYFCENNNASKCCEVMYIAFYINFLLTRHFDTIKGLCRVFKETSIFSVNICFCEVLCFSLSFYSKTFVTCCDVMNSILSRFLQ